MLTHFDMSVFNVCSALTVLQFRAFCSDGSTFSYVFFETVNVLQSGRACSSYIFLSRTADLCRHSWHRVKTSVPRNLLTFIMLLTASQLANLA